MLETADRAKRSTRSSDYAGAAGLVRKLHVPRQARRGNRRRATRRSKLMALLQISEPGMSPEPHQQRLAVGIDLGTTNSLVATVRSGVPAVLPDAHGRPLLPSIVRYRADGKVEVGYAAQAQPGRRSEEHHRLGQALHGPRREGRGARRERALRLRRRARHGADPHRRRREEPGRGLRGDPEGAARARGAVPARRSLRAP